MLPVIIAFDPELPIVTSREVSIGGRVFAADQPFPWRELGIDVLTLHAFYRSGYVRCAPAGEPATASTLSPSQAPAHKRKR